MLQVVSNRVGECEWNARQYKVLLYLGQVEDHREISSPSVSIHADDVSSNEATDTFFDMLSCSELDTL